MIIDVLFSQRNVSYHYYENDAGYYYSESTNINGG